MSLDAINDYFRKLYWLKGDDALDAKDILRLLRERGRSLDFPFETIAGEFRLIETAMVPVIVPWCGADGLDDTAKRLLEQKMKVREVVRILERNGFEITRQSGSHRRFKGIVNRRTRMVTVPGADGDDVPKGTLGSLRRQSGLPAHLFR